MDGERHMGTGRTFQAERAKARAGKLAGKSMPSTDVSTLAPRPHEMTRAKVKNLSAGLKSERIKSPGSFQGPGAKMTPVTKGRWGS